MRVDLLTARIDAEGTQVNPMMCSRASSGELVLLDGATRTESLRRLGLEHAVVQIVDPDDVELRMWSHVIRGCEEKDLLDAIDAVGALQAVSGTDPPTLKTESGSSYSVTGSGISLNARLAALVDSYVGVRKVNRITDARDESLDWRFPDWVAVVEFPALTMEDVMRAAIRHDLLPAGITRFLISGRALRLNIELDLLRKGTEEEKEEALESLLSSRALAGRIRRYEEAVVILDD